MRKVFVTCPAYLATGGTELLHQLVYKLINNYKIEAYIFYPNVQKELGDCPTPSKFVKYIGNNWVEKLEDSPNQILIIPETTPHIIDKYNKTELWIWWLSVDNFFLNLGTGISYKTYIKPNLKWKLIKLFNLKPYKKLNKVLNTLSNKQNIKLHLYQSEYANLFLQKLGVQHINSLSDYINQCLINKLGDKTDDRLNQVLYNPAKGFEITSQLIKSFPKIKWVPIVKMTSEEISKLMASSKIYIDFGSHPGKDRLPREAALNGCCIIVNKEGAANNKEDINIPEKFKISNPIKEQDRIILLIKEIFEDYNNHYLQFEDYRIKIKKEESTFEIEVKQIVKSIGV